jgi:hypothetical protein
LRNPTYIGIIRNLTTSHTHHPETGQRKIKLTPEEAVEKEVPELRIIPQPLWDAVQAELDRRAASNPRAARAAHRAKYLLSGLLQCSCCGAPYAMFKGKSEELEAETADLKQRITDTESRIAQQNAPQPDAKEIFTQALQKMEQLLSDPAYVDEASTYLKMLIKRIVLTPDASSQHSMKVTMMLAEDALMPVPSEDRENGDEGLPVEC